MQYSSFNKVVFNSGHQRAYRRRSSSSYLRHEALRWKGRRRSVSVPCRTLKGFIVAQNFKAPVGSTLQNHLSTDGRWRIRPMRLEEAPTVAALQADAFYEPLPLGPVNNLLRYAFKAEVLSGLRQKLQYSPQEGFTCLVAESARDPSDILGVVEISLQAGKPELAALQRQGFEELVYAYVACMAVEGDHRRQGIASALLRAAEIQAGKWRQNWVLLHVFNDNSSGVSLYQQNEYVEVCRDPAWQQLLGRRQRLLLIKGAGVTSPAGTIQSISNSVLRIFQQSSQQAPQQGP